MREFFCTFASHGNQQLVGHHREAVTAVVRAVVRPMVWCTSLAQGANSGPVMMPGELGWSVQEDVIDFS